MSKPFHSSSFEIPDLLQAFPNVGQTQDTWKSLAPWLRSRHYWKWL